MTLSDALPAERLQPWLHDRAVVLSAPCQVWSDPSGRMGTRPIDGVYVGDRRLLSAYEVVLGGVAPEPVAFSRHSAGSVSFVSLARQFPAPTADPRVRVEQHRDVAPDRVRERLVVRNGGSARLQTILGARFLASDDDMQAVKGGVDPSPLPLRRRQSGIVFAGTGCSGELLVSDDAVVEVSAERGQVEWNVDLGPGEETRVEWTLLLRETGGAVAPAVGASEWADVEVISGDSRLSRWIRHSLDDLSALRMRPVEGGGGEFLAAGAPWFFTLFGRDSIWAARFLLPLGTRLAEGTLSTLAARQGRTDDDRTGEQPGKILHELRARPLRSAGGELALPPLYYGSVDATPLWICLLHDAWKWGMPASSVRALLPALQAALGWMRDFGDADGDGFLEYEDHSGRGLANQGWKDSSDSIQWRDGRLAAGPIALAEVQGYAFEAAMSGAEILDAFGIPGGAAWREWAARLRARFAETFWCEDDRGRYPGVALDRDKRLVDSVASNMGHLLGTGILSTEEARSVADRLAGTDMASGFGVRTLSSTSGGYWPLSYHGGSVWPHDTAIAVRGLALEGFAKEAADAAEALVRAAEAFEFDVPELYSGDASGEWETPASYPAACHPQAWSAASSVVVLQTLLGLRPGDDGLSAHVSDSALARGVRVDGLRFAGRRYVFREGRLTPTPESGPESGKALEGARN